MREQIKKTKENTENPFGVNIMLMNPEADAIARVVVEEGVKVVTTAEGISVPNSSSRAITNSNKSRESAFKSSLKKKYK